MPSIVKRIAMAMCLAILAAPAAAQERAYAPENLRTLSYNDQVRVISLEYSEQSNGRRIPDDQLRFYIDQVNRSNWGFSRIKADIAKSLGGNTVPQPPAPGGTIRCESSGSRSQTCRTPWPGPSRLVRQLSNAACKEGVSWQSQQGQVYVGNGCRAEFAAAPVAPPVASIRCDSNGSRYQTCNTPWRGKSRLQRQVSDAACIEGRSWGSTPGQVWVSRGCRAEFVPVRNVVAPYTVTCSSSSVVPTTCAWDRNRGRPYLLQQLSNARCTQGQTWGYNASRGLWVSAGCRARFGAR